MLLHQLANRHHQLRLFEHLKINQSLKITDIKEEGLQNGKNKMLYYTLSLCKFSNFMMVFVTCFLVPFLPSFLYQHENHFMWWVYNRISWFVDSCWKKNYTNIIQLIRANQKYAEKLKKNLPYLWDKTIAKINLKPQFIY